MEENKGLRLREIDIKAAIRRIRDNKKLFSITLCVTFAVSSFIIMCVPRFYVCSVKLAPESTSANMGGLGALASSFGLNMSNLTSKDAIIPEFYPDVMESVDYQTDMFDVKIKTKDGKINTTYYNYLLEHQKSPWWMLAVEAIRDIFQEKETDADGKGNKVNPFMLTKTQSDIAKIIGYNIQGFVDKKTDVITITVKDQDPVVCATIADSAMTKLQQFIIKYRTGKAQNDLEQAKRLSVQAKEKYTKAQQIYASYSDANEDVVLQSFKSKIDELENEMQLQYNNYQVTVQQMQLARAKLQERTPAFTTLQSATVPLKPAGPKRMMFVLACLLLAFTVTYIYVYKKNI